MENLRKIAGGIFVFILLFFTYVPFNDEIQGLALATGASEVEIAFAIVFPYLWIGFIFTVLAYTGYEIITTFT